VTPAGLRGVVNDAVAIHFLDPALAAALCVPLVRRIEGRDQRGGISGALGSANHARSTQTVQDFLRKWGVSCNG
jgi:hypothetical protein